MGIVAMEQEAQQPQDEITTPGGAKQKKKRKRSPIKGTRPDQSARLKELWADPEWRAKTLAAKEAALVKAPPRRRVNVPDGMSKDIAKRFWKQARFEATLTMKKLDKVGALDDCSEEAREALHAALSVMRSPMNQATTLAAARLVLDFTKAKPASKSEITVNKAEEWLAAVTEANDKASNDSDAGDAEASS